ncbi:hypothetical protein [Pseudomonas rustica]|uniref:Uncharacterized protein n=1 Tax=Pseudomonas rustica TaxID=2827099 RepID=A0ABS5MUY4_9PSED|nr:hypothetical protein [Pseudomonas rustica]MBS4078100.1 hypothetical protein [Pseudomonas rustica]
MPEKETYFSFIFSVPYLNEDLTERTYKLGDGQGLSFSHSHSVPAPSGGTAFTSINADEAELTIRLDRTSGTVTGDYFATFKSRRYRLRPEGTFQLTRTDQ